MPLSTIVLLYYEDQVKMWKEQNTLEKIQYVKYVTLCCINRDKKRTNRVILFTFIDR